MGDHSPLKTPMGGNTRFEISSGSSVGTIKSSWVQKESETIVSRLINKFTALRNDTTPVRNIARVLGQHNHRLQPQ